MKRILIIAVVLSALNSYSQNFEAGEAIFKANCSACHKMDSKLIGPPLENTVADQGFEWTKKWIYNNQELRESGDAHTIEIFEEYNQQIMPPYSYLADQELTDLVTYLQDWKSVEAEKVAAEAKAGGAEGEKIKKRPYDEPREFPTVVSISLPALVLFLLLFAATLLTIYKAFKTMADLNKTLYDKMHES